MSDRLFSESHILHELKHYLPTQSALKDFIHHNSLHAFQQMKFYDAIQKAGKIFGYQATLQLKEFRTMYKNGRIRKDVLDMVIANRKGRTNLLAWKENVETKQYDDSIEPRIGKLRSNWKTLYGIDLDNAVHPILFRILCAYLDQGIAHRVFPVHEEGFLASLRELEKDNLISFFKTKRARNLLQDTSISIESLLKLVVGNPIWYDNYLFDQQFSHRGWSGIVNALEDFPAAMLDQRKISLRELIILDLLLELDALENEFGGKWKPLSEHLHGKPENILADFALTELDEVFRIWQDAFEWSYYDEVLAGFRAAAKSKKELIPQKTFQAVFCIDERECSIRRHIEAVDTACETLGSPGFFGVEFYFQPIGGKFYDKLCPAPVTPKYLIKEVNAEAHKDHEILYHRQMNNFVVGSLMTLGLGFWAGVKLIQTQFSPRMTPAISDALGHMNRNAELTIENKNVGEKENGWQIGFTIEEMADRVEGFLRNMGLVRDFAPIVYVIAHGSSSANNPHHGAHDCGACSGRPGSVNARVIAHMANHEKVRNLLRERGLLIPEATQFVGGLHDTAADQAEFYDEEKLTALNAASHRKNVASFEKALDLNAKERSRRFASINTKADLKTVRKEILKRSVSMFEPRPELGHGTNTLCIIGRRNLSKGVFLDRRAFMNSYDYTTDPEGKILAGVMRPIGPVCGGINLEYYFSRVDNYKLGAGTKLPHNVMGLFAVSNSCDGDLRPGLPVQMVEVHDPVRLLVIVEHYPDVVLNTIQSAPEMYEWYNNEWVHILSVHPDTGDFYYFRNGNFELYQPLKGQVNSLPELNSFLESAQEMASAEIADATKENLPVYLIK
jgi:uncharacterized protein